MDSCVFCRIQRGEIPCTIIKRGAHCFAFRDIHPQAPHHVLIVPTRHIASLDQLTESDQSLLGELVLLATAVARELGIAQSGYRCVWNCGADGGQSVDHVHLHLLGGRTLAWPPG